MKIYMYLSTRLPRLALVPVLLTKPLTLSNVGIESTARNNCTSLILFDNLCNVCKIPAKSNFNNIISFALNIPNAS